jgi:O-antigen/teichoic acid export membrane protein
VAGAVWWWLSSPTVNLVLKDSGTVGPAKKVLSINEFTIEKPTVNELSNSEINIHESITDDPVTQEPQFGWAEIKDGVMAQLGQLILFLIYRMPIFMCSAWMLEIWGFKSQEAFPSNRGYLDFTGLAGVLSNVLLIADTLWIFANSLGGMVHARLLQPEMLYRSESSQNRWIWRFFVLSIFGTAVLALITAVIPKSLYILIFGLDFGEMALYLKIILPGILALGISAVLGHVLHARNQFTTLFWNHALGFILMLMFWFVARKSVWLSEWDFAKYVLLGFDFALLIVMMLNFFSMGEDFRNRIKTPRNILITLQLLFRFIRNRTR